METGFEPRDRMIAYLRSQLIGPADGHGEVISELPSDRYAAGILYPVGTEFADAPPASSAAGDDPLSQATRYFPSAAGLSFLVPEGATLQVVSQASRYVRVEVPPVDDADAGEGTGNEFPDDEDAVDEGQPRRKRVAWQEERLGVAATAPELLVARSGETTRSLLGGAARLHVEGRSVGSDILLTVVVVNAAEADQLKQAHGRQGPSKRTIAANCLYQVELSVLTHDEVHPYPTAGAGLSDLEDAELAFQYRTRPVYAVGHGVSANWDIRDRSAVLRTECLPATLVRSIRYDRPTSDPDRWRYDETVLQLDRLREVTDPAATLKSFVDAYEAWFDDQRAVVGRTATDSDLEPIEAISAKQRSILDRMRAGVELLAADAVTREAFQLACRTIADQMRRPAAPQRLTQPPTLRPFQLAFFLVVLPGLVDPSRDDHDLVDLLWFPTGGGKTEAYLLISAFEVFRRRLRAGGDDEGVVVLSRYTLRLLTTQQFQRTVAMACAADLVRREDEARLGHKPISVGLWVGGTHSPNNYKQAVEEWLPRWESGQDILLIPECPWCGERIIDPKAARHGVEATDGSFTLRCTSDECPFSSPSSIPAHFVDDAIYDERPSIVIATVDKLAWLPMWGRDRVRILGGAGQLGPSLILQDELHLLNGPLGTTAAVYEVGLDALFGAGSGRPKVIASTATIRRAADQAASLFGRELALFPPNGFTPDDSYYSLTDPDERRARLYVGLMSVGSTWQATSVYALTALAQGAFELAPEDRDPYWTSVVYANSLEDHGRIVTLVSDDVRARLRQLASDEGEARRLDEVVELRGAGDTSTLIDILGRLSRPAGVRGAIDVVISTNLIQVGIDISRLGLIVFVGQPKGVSEYIQASSRVGRVSDAPGIVLTVFSHTRARDRSHYESFRAFHESLYRWVEPMSVTPFSTAALDRLMPAALTLAVRHGTTPDMRPDDGASRIADHPADLQAIAEGIAKRAGIVSDEEGDQVRACVQRLLRDWEEAVQRPGPGYLYFGGGKEHRRLLRVFGERDGLWDVQSSMRSVEPDVSMFIYELDDVGRRKA